MDGCPEGGSWRLPRKRAKVKRGLAAVSRAARSIGALFRRIGKARRPGGRGPSTQVVLIDPPCLVAGSDCLVDVHLSQEPRVSQRGPPRASQQILAKEAGGGRTVVEAPTAGGFANVVSIFLADVKACGYRVECAPGDPKDQQRGHEGCWKARRRKLEGHPKDRDTAAILLALPRDAAGEVCDLFEKMVAAFKKGITSGAPGICRCEPGHCGRAGPDAEDTRLEAAAKEAVWTSCFRHFCSDLARALDGPPSGAADSEHDRCAPLATYLVANGMWHAASFLLTTRLRSGTRVTLGPFALSEADLAAESLRADFGVVGEGGAGLAVGGGGWGFGELAVGSGDGAGGLALEETEGSFVLAFE